MPPMNIIVDLASLQTGLAKFSSEFYFECAEAKPDHALAVSSFLIASTMALFCRAVQNGQSPSPPTSPPTPLPFNQIVKTLHLSITRKTTVDDYFGIVHEKFGETWMTVKNQLFINKNINIKPEFIRMAETNFDLEIKPINFNKQDKASRIINEYLGAGKKQLKQQIFAKEIDNRLILVTTIRFDHYHWEIPFNKAETRSETFFLSQGKKASASFMHTKGEFFYMQSRPLNAKVLRMNYRKLGMYCLAILPNEESSLTELQRALKGYDITQMLPKMEEKVVEVSFPKFTGECVAFELTDTLKKMGILNIFGDNQNFKGMLLDETRHMTISDIFHKTVIKFKEDPSLSFADTDNRHEINVKETDIQIEFNRPFAYLVIRKPDTINYSAPTTILFNGHYKGLPDTKSELNKFSLELFKQCALSDKYNDVLIATFSVISGLIVLSHGAEGVAFEQIRSALGLTENKNSNLEYLRLELNALDGGTMKIKLSSKEKPMNINFITSVKEIFTSKPAFSKFSTFSGPGSDKEHAATKNILNSFTDTDLRKLTLELVGEFEGKWKIPFVKSEAYSFHTIRDETVKLPFMQAKGLLGYAYIEALQAKAVRLDYANSVLYCLIILPNSTKDFVSHRSALVNVDIANLKMQEKIVEVFIPRVALNYYTDLEQPLKNLKITEIFNQDAELEGIFHGNDPTFVSKIMHRGVAALRENQETESDESEKDESVTEVKFEAVRPFIISIINKDTGTILFIGHFQGPSQSKPLWQSALDYLNDKVNNIIEIVADFSLKSKLAIKKSTGYF